MLPIVTSIVDMSILSIITVAINSLLTHRRKIHELCFCRRVLEKYRDTHSCRVTLIICNNSAAGWVDAVMKLYNPTVVYVIYHGQRADGTGAAHIPMHGCRTYISPVDIIPYQSDDMSNDIPGTNRIMMLRYSTKVHEVPQLPK
jgi:hypothetical protein